MVAVEEIVMESDSTLLEKREDEGSNVATGSSPLLSIKGLYKWFPVKKRGLVGASNVSYIKAIDGVSFDVYKGESFGLVGESGSGKSTVSKCIVKLEEPTEGSIQFKGEDVTELKSKNLARFRRSVQMIFQDPFSSLDPRMLVGDIMKEGLVIHYRPSLPTRMVNAVFRRKISSESGDVLSEDAIHGRMLWLLKKVGLEVYHSLRYSHEFSGGQRQRIGIARALSLSPEFIIADEPVSALDVSVQASILNLLSELRAEFNLTLLFIAHDLSVVRHVCDRVAVMYLGRIMEIASCDELFSSPMHPYSISLLSAIPHPDPRLKRERIILEGDIPSPIDVPSGCRFHPRCFKATDECQVKEPELIELEEGRFVACLYPEKMDVLNMGDMSSPK